MKKSIGICKVNSKSNFRNLNGIQLSVIEIVGTRVTIQFKFDYEIHCIDYHINELTMLTIF